MSNLTELSKPFEGKFVKQKPGKSKASYVEHSDITQRLLQVVGPYDQHVTQVIRGDVGEVLDKDTGEVKHLAKQDVIVGCVLSLSAIVDGVRTTIEEIGEVEHPHNHSTDASRLKFAVSDAFKRCAMRLGLGLHLWCQDHYFLHTVLTRDEQKPATNGRARSKANGQTTDPAALVVQKLKDEGIDPQRFVDFLGSTYGVEKFDELSAEDRTKVVTGLTTGDLVEQLREGASA